MALIRPPQHHRVTPRSVKEMLSAAAALASAALFFGGGSVRLVSLGILIALVSAGYGWRAASTLDRSIVLFLGVSAGLLLLMIEVPILNIGFTGFASIKLASDRMGVTC